MYTKISEEFVESFLTADINNTARIRIIIVPIQTNTFFYKHFFYHSAQFIFLNGSNSGVSNP